MTEEQRQIIRRSSEGVLREPPKETPRQVNEAAITRLYAAVGLRRPLFFYADSPLQLMQMAFLLQVVASVPHGSRRKELSRSHISLPPADLSWRLSQQLPEPWRQSLQKLTAQLNAERLERLADDSHHDSTRVSYYAKPDLLVTCGSRLGFPMAPALAALLEEVSRDCLSSVWQRYSTTIARELVALLQEHLSHHQWRLRIAAEMALLTGEPMAGVLTPGFIGDLNRDARCSPLPKSIRDELFIGLDSDLLLELLFLQDTRCYHERVDGTSALKPAAHMHQQSASFDQRLLDACINGIYALSWGNWSRDDLCIWQAAETIFGPSLYSDRLRILLNDFSTMRAHGFIYNFNSRSVFICATPTRIDWDTRNQLHNWEQPAIEFLDGTSWRFWRGMYISPERFDKLQKVTLEKIHSEMNVELRRVLIDRFGAAEYLIASGARQMHSDQYGTLFRKELLGDEPLVMVRVRNSTAEPDGSFKHYFLRVPPHITTAREAVAWTFEMQTTEYSPHKQS